MHHHHHHPLRWRAAIFDLRNTVGPVVMSVLTALTSIVGGHVVFVAASRALFGADGQRFASHATVIFALACVVGVIVRFGWPKVVVGNDGIRVERAWANGFIPYADLDEARSDANSVELRMKDGRSIRLPTVGMEHENIAAVARRIDQTRAACPAHGRMHPGISRQGRSVKRWRVDLEASARACGFREQSLRGSDLAAVLADPAASPEQRVGAALALRVAVSNANASIRVAAAGCAKRELQAALESCGNLGECDEDLIARALG